MYIGINFPYSYFYNIEIMLHHKFIDTSKRLGQKLAIHDCTMGKRLTYNQVLIATLLLSRYVKNLRTGCVGVMLPTSAGCILTKLAVLMAGRIPVMINYSTGAEQNKLYAEQTCNFTTTITSRTLLEKIDYKELEGMVFIEDILTEFSWRQKITAKLLSTLPATIIKLFVYGGNEEDTAYILFTSGSEKDPKAVPLSHKNIEANIDSILNIFHFTSDEVFMCTLPYFHSFGLTTALWLPLLQGMKLLTLADPLDFKRTCTLVKKHSASFLVGTPYFFWGYLRKSDPGDFSTLRIALTGADKCPDSLRQAFLDKHKITLLEGYGTTECSPVVSANTLTCNRPGSVGKPLPNVEVRIEDYETGKVCGVGEDGRILVRGDNVMKGYFNNFEQTSLHLRHGWYDTGDVGNIDRDGYLWHVGRFKRFVKVGGEMVNLVKVEDVLEKMLPKDASCCVVDVPDVRKGSRIIVVTTSRLNEKVILKKMAKELPKIALPKKFLVWESLPRMGSGKVDFRKITEITRKKMQAGNER